MNSTIKKIISSFLVLLLLTGCMTIRAEDSPETNDPETIEVEQMTEDESGEVLENGDSEIYQDEGNSEFVFDEEIEENQPQGNAEEGQSVQDEDVLNEKETKTDAADINDILDYCENDVRNKIDKMFTNTDDSQNVYIWTRSTFVNSTGGNKNRGYAVKTQTDGGFIGTYDCKDEYETRPVFWIDLDRFE
ncbi:MAG: hypothetical protein IJI66_10510 [Erysipelotrichaceae bacterium]|nr:hypothetical protein [Erysipelotrichaceae bacterium]